MYRGMLPDVAWKSAIAEIENIPLGPIGEKYDDAMFRVCIECGAVVEIDKFPVSVSHGDVVYYRSFCEECLQKRSAMHAKQAKMRRAKNQSRQRKFVCTKCGKKKARKDFYKTDTKKGVSAQCRKCILKSQAAYRKRKPKNAQPEKTSTALSAPAASRTKTMPVMKYCFHCGKEILSGYNFCPACGTNLSKLFEG